MSQKSPEEVVAMIPESDRPKFMIKIITELRDLRKENKRLVKELANWTGEPHE